MEERDRDVAKLPYPFLLPLIPRIRLMYLKFFRELVEKGHSLTLFHVK